MSYEAEMASRCQNGGHFGYLDFAKTSENHQNSNQDVKKNFKMIQKYQSQCL